MVELLIVIVIIGILAVIGLNNFMSSQSKARDAQRKSDLATLSKTIEMYRADWPTYPDDTSGLVMGVAWGDVNGMVDINGTVYLPKMVKDPGKYSYFYELYDANTYRLCAKLENDKDKDAVEAGYSGTDCQSGSVECNYCISSSNVTITP